MRDLELIAVLGVGVKRRALVGFTLYSVHLNRKHARSANRALRNDTTSGGPHKRFIENDIINKHYQARCE
jgi:hypothetical protein